MKPFTKKLIKITLIIALIFVSITALYFTYAIFINPLWEVQIEGEISKEEIDELPKVKKISESDLKSILKTSPSKYILVQFWSLGISCTEQFDSTFVNTLFRKYSDLKYILISFNLNAKKYDLVIGSYLKNKGIFIPSYQIDKKINVFDLKNEDNLSEFLENTFKNFNNSNSLIFLVDKSGFIISDFDDIVNSPTKYQTIDDKFNYIYSILDRYCLSGNK